MRVDPQRLVHAPHPDWCTLRTPTGRPFLSPLRSSVSVCVCLVESEAHATTQVALQATAATETMMVADPFAGIPFWRVLALALAVPAVQAILTGINLSWLAVLVSPLHALCFLCILTIQWLWQHPAKEALMPLWQERSVCRTGLEPETSRPQAGLPLTRVSLSPWTDRPRALRAHGLQRDAHRAAGDPLSTLAPLTPLTLPTPPTLRTLPTPPTLRTLPTLPTLLALRTLRTLLTLPTALQDIGADPSFQYLLTSAEPPASAPYMLSMLASVAADLCQALHAATGHVAWALLHALGASVSAGGLLWATWRGGGASSHAVRGICWAGAFAPVVSALEVRF